MNRVLGHSGLMVFAQSARTLDTTYGAEYLAKTISFL